MPGKVSEPRELFVQDLGAMLKAEKQLAKALPRMQKAARDDELSRRLERHVGETRRHVENLERALEEMGARPKASRAAGVEGLEQEFRESSQSVAPELKDVVTAGVSARMDHYEIGAYESLLAMARALGERRVAELLDRNLKDEKEMLRDGKKVARRIGREAARATSG